MRHGTSASYARGCRCSECREARMDYQRELRVRRRPALLRARGIARMREGAALLDQADTLEENRA